VAYEPALGLTTKTRPMPSKDYQYENARRNVGTITWDGNVVLPEKAIPKIIESPNGKYVNPSYEGEVVLFSPSEKKEIKDYLSAYNLVEINYNSKSAATIVVNTNFNDNWQADNGKVEDHYGRLAVVVPAGSGKLVLRFYDRSFYLGCWIAGASAIGFLLLFVGIRRRRI
jgi:hypothetical protein